MEAPEELEKQIFVSRRHTIRFTLVFILVVLCSALALLFVYIKVNQPLEGTIIPTKQPTDDTTAPTTKTLTTQYYTAQYPVNYDLESKPANSASLSAEALKAHEQNRFGTGSRITLTVEAAPPGGVSDHPSYKLYKSQPEIYTVVQEQIKGENIVIASRANPNFEKTILWHHGNYILTVTLIADTQTSSLDADLQTILTSIQW